MVAPKQKKVKEIFAFAKKLGLILCNFCQNNFSLKYIITRKIETNAIENTILGYKIGIISIDNNHSLVNIIHNVRRLL